MVESKKLFSAEKAAEMNADLQKMQSFEFLPSLHESIGSKADFSIYAVLLAITAYPGNEKWWCEPYQYDGRSWDALGQSLAKAIDKGIVLGVCHLSAACFICNLSCLDEALRCSADRKAAV